MKKALTFLLLLTALAVARAGERDNYVSINAGVMYPRLLNINAAYQKELSYGNAVEAYLDYQTQWNECPDCGTVCTHSFWKSRYSYAVGLAYKKAVMKRKNAMARVRIGGDLGASNRKFAASLEAGIEYALTMTDGVQFVFSQKNEVMFWGKPTWKTGVLAGVRVRL